MGPDTLKHIFGLMIPLLALCIPIIAILGGVRLKMHREQLAHETLRQFAEKGLPVPPELLATLQRNDSGKREWSSRSYLRFGVINCAVGLGLMLMFYLMAPGSWLWAIGGIPTFTGLAMLLLWKIELADKSAKGQTAAAETSDSAL